MSTPQVEEIEEYRQTTRNIEVTVQPRFEEEQSDIDSGVYAYSYTVTLTNQGEESAQLINRHWLVMSAGRQIADVKGEGVVGEQPLLRPNDTYQYTSFTMVRDTVGAMFGSYTFYSEKGEFFDVEIPQFSLLYVESDSIH